MEITKLMGQVQTEEEKKKEREKTAKLIQSFSKNSGLIDFAGNNLNKALMFNPAKESEKAFLGAAMFNYVSPIEEEEERQQRQREDREKWEPSFQETQERLERGREAHEQMLIRVQVEASRIIAAEKLAQQGSDKHQVNIDAGTGKVNAGAKPAGKRDRQIDLICKIANELKFDLMAIPEKDKATIKIECLKQTHLFTEDGYKKAWLEATKRKLISIQDKEKYL